MLINVSITGFGSGRVQPIKNEYNNFTMPSTVVSLLTRNPDNVDEENEIIIGEGSYPLWQVLVVMYGQSFIMPSSVVGRILNLKAP